MLLLFYLNTIAAVFFIHLLCVYALINFVYRVEQMFLIDMTLCT